MPIPRLHSAAEFSRKSLRLTAAWIVLASTVAFAQSGPVSAPLPSATTTPAPSAPTFDVATIKPHPSNGNLMSLMGARDTPDGLDASNVPLYLLVQVAYGLPGSGQIKGGPDWAKNEPYDIQAKMSGADVATLDTLTPAEQKTRRQLMLQALLADRFKLKTHSETKQVPTFDLVTTKDTSRLKDAATDPNRKMNKEGKPSTGIRFSQGSADVMNESMASFAGFLSGPMSAVGRPVVDKTGLTSTYNFTLNWAPQLRGMPGAASSTDTADEAPSIFTALGELGLKLQPSTGPIQTIVIDHAERPSAD